MKLAINVLCSPLQFQDARRLSVFLSRQNAEYMQYFNPFNFGVETLQNILASRIDDVYMGFFLDENLVGFFMLRGWDSGYETPSYGIVIDQHFAGFGFARLSLEYSKTLCRLRGAKKMMLKVHVENLRAERIYKNAGFVQAGFDVKNNNKIYYFDLE